MNHQNIERFLQSHSEAMFVPAGFHELLLRYLIRSGTSDAKIAADAQISKSTLSRIVSKKTAVPARDTVLALGLALHLNEDELSGLLRARDLHDAFPLGKRDFLILYHIRQGDFSLTMINITLDAYSCALLGCNSS